MEALGAVASAVTLVALFKSCIEAFDTIELYKSQDTDFKKLLLRLNVEKCRLYIWGQSMRLVSDEPGNALDGFPFPDLVTECLTQIVDLFNDSGRIQNKYGCRASPPDSLAGGRASSQRRNFIIRTFAAAFGHFRVRSSQTAARGKMPLSGVGDAGVLKKTIWVIHDRKKFMDLVHEVKNLIDGLQDITKNLVSARKLEDDVRSRITNIRDFSTLEMVADVCGEHYPRIAEVASTCADSVSMAATERQDVVAWLSEVEGEGPAGLLAARLEDLTIADLRYLVLHDQNQSSSISVTRAEGHDTTVVTSSTDQRPKLTDIDMDTTRELANIFSSSADLVMSAVRGTYDNRPGMPFFASFVEPSQTPALYLRARVNIENQRFYRRICQMSFSDNELESLLGRMDLYEALEPNAPNAVQVLFRHCAASWPQIAHEHTNSVSTICNEFLTALVGHVSPKQMHERLGRHYLVGRMEKYMFSAHQELHQLKRDLWREDLSYNAEYQEHVTNRAPNDRQRSVSERLAAYYEFSARIFVQNVRVQVVERHLLQGLEGIFKMTEIFGMSDEMKRVIAAEGGGSGPPSAAVDIQEQDE